MEINLGNNMGINMGNIFWVNMGNIFLGNDMGHFCQFFFASPRRAPVDHPWMPASEGMSALGLPIICTQMKLLTSPAFKGLIAPELRIL